LKQDTYNQQLAQFSAKHDGRFPVIQQLPCLTDDDSGHDHCPIYLHFLGWASRILAKTRPASHADFGGLTYFSAIASAICPITFYDIREVRISLPDVKVEQADLTRLPLSDGSLKSLSCMHVLEHVGLGRYGDTLDVQGDLKAAGELKRVLAPGGQALIVLPVGQPKVMFNAHRIYSYQQVLEMFKGLELKEFTLFDPPQYIVNANPERVKGISEGAGCFWFKNA
jgi:hypothetical protein